MTSIQHTMTEELSLLNADKEKLCILAEQSTIFLLNTLHLVKTLMEESGLRNKAKVSFKKSVS